MKKIENQIIKYKVERFHECEDCKGKGKVMDTSEENYGEFIEYERCNGKKYFEKWN